MVCTGGSDGTAERVSDVIAGALVRGGASHLREQFNHRRRSGRGSLPLGVRGSLPLGVRR